MGRHSFSLISQKSRNSDAFRRIGKPDTSCLVVLVYSSHFVDRDQVANGRGAVCDGAKFRYKSLKNEINAAAYHSNHGKYSFGSAIFEYSRGNKKKNIKDIFLETKRSPGALNMPQGQDGRASKRKKSYRKPMNRDLNLHVRGKLCPEVAASPANDLVPRYFETSPMGLVVRLYPSNTFDCCLRDDYVPLDSSLTKVFQIYWWGFLGRRLSFSISSSFVLLFDFLSF